MRNSELGYGKISSRGQHWRKFHPALLCSAIFFEKGGLGVLPEAPVRRACQPPLKGEVSPQATEGLLALYATCCITFEMRTDN